MTKKYIVHPLANRVYYVSEKIMKLGSNVARENLISLGTCFGSPLIIGSKVKMN